MGCVPDLHTSRACIFKWTHLVSRWVTFVRPSRAWHALIQRLLLTQCPVTDVDLNVPFRQEPPLRTLQLYDNLALPALRTSAPCTFATMYPACTRFRDHSALESCMDRRTQARHSAVHTLPVVDERLQCRSAHTYHPLMRHSPFDTPWAPWLMAFAAAEEPAPAAVTS
jgi:hypothetical protein